MGGADKRVASAIRELTDYDIDDALDTPKLILTLIGAFDNGYEVTVDVVRQLVAVDQFSDQDLHRRLQAWRAETARARESDVWGLVRPESSYPSLRELTRSARVVMDIESIWDRLYESEKDAKREEQRTRLCVAASFDDFDLADPDSPRRSSYEERLHEAEVARESIRAEMRVAQTNRASIAEPLGLRWEVVVLLLVAALTILPSLLLLGPQPAQLSGPQSGAVMLAFVAGLGLLIAYLLTWAERARAAWHESESSIDDDRG